MSLLLRKPICSTELQYMRVILSDTVPNRYHALMANVAVGKTDDPEQLNEHQAAMGMPPLPHETEPTAQALAEYLEWLREYEDRLRKAGWRQG
jgi:hypothetical protein